MKAAKVELRNPANNPWLYDEQADHHKKPIN
jgi:hypothetical protein